MTATGLRTGRLPLSGWGCEDCGHDHFAPGKGLFAFAEQGLCWKCFWDFGPCCPEVAA